MGFGSYDETEQEKMDVQSDEEDEEDVQKQESEHDGEVEFEMEDTESAIDRLSKMTGEK